MRARVDVAWFVVLGLVAVGTATRLGAQAPQGAGTWSVAGKGRALATGAATVALPDGRTLVVGGTAPDGAPSSAVMFFDPVTHRTTIAGALSLPRTGHTATALASGQVVVAGGVMGGEITSAVDVFDPKTGTVLRMTLLPEPRSGHVAAPLASGLVLLAGGRGTGGEVLASAVLFDPATGEITSLEAVLNTARADATATTLIDGRVLVVGGSDGASDLASAEIFDPFTQSFIAVDAQMSVSRRGHSAVLLPNNASVLVAGGSSDGVPQYGADLFLPVEIADLNASGAGRFSPTGSMSARRTGAVLGPLASEGYAFAASGGAAATDVYRFATIRTDKDSYVPGAPAVITGTGWAPREAVRLRFREDPAVHDDLVLDVTADAQGNIFCDRPTRDRHERRVRVYVTATGTTSAAQTTFTYGLHVEGRRTASLRPN